MDNAHCFTLRELRQFCFRISITHDTTTTYYSQLSHADRFNRMGNSQQPYSNLVT